MLISDNQLPNQTTMPTTSTVYPSTSQSTSEPRFNPTLGSIPQPEVRVIHQHVAYTLGPNPVKMTCPSCLADIKTTTISDHQPSAHLCCIVLCLLGWVLHDSVSLICCIFILVTADVDYFSVKTLRHYVKTCLSIYCVSSFRRNKWSSAVSTYNTEFF